LDSVGPRADAGVMGCVLLFYV